MKEIIQNQLDRTESTGLAQKVWFEVSVFFFCLDFKFTKANSYLQIACNVFSKTFVQNIFSDEIRIGTCAKVITDIM